MKLPRIMGLTVVLLISAVVFVGGCISQENLHTSTPSNSGTGTQITYTDLGGLTAPELEKMVSSSNTFALELYHRIYNKEDNIFLSPYSVFIALSMVYEGAEGKTAEEMRGILHIPGDSLTRREGARELILKIDNPPNDAYTLRTANALWLQKGYPVKESYVSVLKKFYLSEIGEVDFKNNPRGAESQINRWAEEQTAGKIRKLVSGLSPLTRLVITNAIYFKANWSRRFDPHNTRNETFYTSSGTVTVPMMHQKGIFNYSENSEFQAIELSYQGNRLSMVILLPRGNNISSLEKELNPDFINGILKGMAPEHVKVIIPKFKFERTYLLRGTLMEMGMKKAFSDEANFSGISDEPLAISQVVHKTFISVAENGTEAAAATAVVITAASAPGQGPKYKIFKADHPFVFMIIDRETGAILFMGRLMNPRG